MNTKKDALGHRIDIIEPFTLHLVPQEGQNSSKTIWISNLHENQAGILAVHALNQQQNMHSKWLVYEHPISYDA